jgi:CBS domain containing-hemolysin-like protein
VTLLLVAITAALAVLLCFVTVVQTLYLESLRLRTRDVAALQFFKETLQPKIGLKPDQGALAFSLVKHTALTLLGVVVLAATSWTATHVWHGIVSAILFALALMFVSSYLVPQFLYRRTSLRWLVYSIPAIRAVAAAIRPVTWLMNFMYSLSELGSEPEAAKEEAGSAEHIDALITAGEEEGIIERDDRKLIQSVVAFGDKTVREVMTPRPNMVAIEANKSLQALRDLVIHERYSRIPVFQGDIDQMVGFVHVRDMFELDEEARAHKKVRDLMREIPLVPETKPVHDLLREMQDEGRHISVVIDEYGNTAGLVTMEDLVEVIVGEIHDEHEPERDVEQESDGVYVVSGSFDVDRLHDLFDFRVPEDTESTTVGGLVTEWLGRVPAKGEIIDRNGLHMEVLAGNERRVESLRISRIAQSEPQEAAVPEPASKTNGKNGNKGNGR